MGYGVSLIEVVPGGDLIAQRQQLATANDESLEPPRVLPAHSDAVSEAPICQVRVLNLTLMTDFHPTPRSSHHGRPKLVVREHLHGRYTDWVRVFGDAWTASTASAATSQCKRDNPRCRQEAA